MALAMANLCPLNTPSINVETALLVMLLFLQQVTTLLLHWLDLIHSWTLYLRSLLLFFDSSFLSSKPRLFRKKKKKNEKRKKKEQRTKNKEKNDVWLDFTTHDTNKSRGACGVIVLHREPDV